MPTYDYICQECFHEFEEMQKISASPLTLCPSCAKNSLKRKFGGGIGLSFTGSGFYSTDYKSGGQEPPSQKGSCCPCGKNSNGCK